MAEQSLGRRRRHQDDLAYDVGLLVRHFQGDRAIYLATMERSRDAWTADGLMPRGGPEAVNRVGEGAPLAPADVARHFTNAFALKAKARFRA